MKYDIDSINKRKKVKRIIQKILGVVLIILVYNIMLTFISSNIFNDGLTIFGYKACIITSNSMEPTINNGDVVIIKKINNEELFSGDIITFKQKEECITHRILKIEENKYTTKGDNNNTEDMEIVEFSNIEGKYVISVPKLGKIIQILNNKLIVLIIILILLIVCFCKVEQLEKMENRRKKKEKKIEESKKKN